VDDRPPPAPHEVVAGLLVRPAQVFLCHRSIDRTWYPNVWDLPGGHVEPGESPTGALVRELREELGIAIAEPSDPEITQIATSALDLKVWVIREWAGTPSNVAVSEHDGMGWFTLAQATRLDLAHQSYPSLIKRVLQWGD
jgi:8-oxo-dGTP diphosphatase